MGKGAWDSQSVHGRKYFVAEPQTIKARWMLEFAFLD